MPVVDTLQLIYQKRGVSGVSRFLYHRYFTSEAYDYRVIARFRLYKQLFAGRRGLEIGGPSNIFETEVPLYKIISSLDGCNFGTETIWEGKIQEGSNYNYLDGRSGWQFVREASDLAGIEDQKYDFVLGSHVLEHCANPLKAVEEWLRVLKPAGVILLVLPDRRFTFDHRRSVTPFEHLKDDYECDVGEDDLTHLGEILELHDLEIDNELANQKLTLETFRERSLSNFGNRALHHHVFDFDLLGKVFEYFNLRIIDKSVAEPFHQIVLGQKP